MDLSDDDDFDVPGSAYGTISPSRSGSRLIQTQAQVEREQFKKQETYENKERNQRQERKRLIREVFNRRLEDFNSREEFEKYDEEREIIIWSKVKGFDRWQYNTSTNPDIWLDLPVADMKELSRSKRRKNSGITVPLLGGSKIAHLGSMSWRASDSTNGKLRSLSASDRIEQEIKLHKETIQKNKNRLLEEEREIESQINEEIYEMEKQLQIFEKYDRKTQYNLNKRMNAVDEEDEEANKRRRYDVYMHSTLEREEWELYDSLHTFHPMVSTMSSRTNNNKINLLE